MEIEIEKLVFGGFGIGRIDGKVVFVKGGIPGERLQVRVIRDRGSYVEAEVEKVVRSSSQRVEPQCFVFGKCGGCQWQHVGYKAQLEAKEYILREALERIGGLKDIEVESIFPSPSQYGYRQRVTLSVWFQKKRYCVGYLEGRSRRGIEIETCPIATEPINGAIKRLSRSLSSIETRRYPLERVYISSDGVDSYITLVPGSNRDLSKLYSLRNHLRKSNETKNTYILGEMEEEFELDILGLKFRAIPSVFIQVNSMVNEQLVRTVMDLATPYRNKRVLDLFSGVGNFSLHLARQSREVFGVDVNARAIRLARKNAKLNSIENAVFEVSDAVEFVKKAARDGIRFDLIVLDPPREGAKEILEYIPKLHAQGIIYVSCNPTTLARDLKMLLHLGYKTIRVYPFDMFPQTYHIESLALLSRI